MRSSLASALGILAAFAALILLHLPLLALPYHWDEAGYYIPAAMDFYHSWSLTPTSTLPSGHTPLVMIYLGLAWRLFGFTPTVARVAMTLIAAATVATLYALGRRVAPREIAAWSAVLLALSPLFFAQSTLAHLDLAAALFTTLAVLFLVGDQVWLFALAASLAVLSKETAVVLLPVAWLYAWWKRRELVADGGRNTRWAWAPFAAPILPLTAWVCYYHHATGFWIGNREYLTYNVYSTLSPARIFWSLLRRAYELFLGGFNWLLTGTAPLGIWWGRKRRDTGAGRRETGTAVRESGVEPERNVAEAQATLQPESRIPLPDSRLPTPNSCETHPDSGLPSPVSRVPHAGPRPWRPFIFLTAGLVAVYLLLLSAVGGAILPRYLLPVMPVFYLTAVAMVTRLPRRAAQIILTATACCFVEAWFINPPYPFPFEDNLAYVDFIRLHEQAARYLEAQPDHPRILTAWPATDELAKPWLGYVHQPLRVVAVQGFAVRDFAKVEPESFDLLYLYSRRWEPPGNWVARFPLWLRLQGRYFDYHPQLETEALAARYHLRLHAEIVLRGQWVRIYGHDPD